MNREYDVTFIVGKEEFKDWIHYNVMRSREGKNNNFRYGAVVCYMTIAIVMCVYNVMHGAGVMQALNVFAFGGIICAYILYSTSITGMERSAYRKNVSRMEKRNDFPNLQVIANEENVTMVIVKTGEKRIFSYREFTDVLESELMYLITTTENRVQFVVKSAFESAEQAAEFAEFLKEKIADAKENPDKYPVPRKGYYNPADDDEEEAEENTEEVSEEESTDEAVEESTDEAAEETVETAEESTEEAGETTEVAEETAEEKEV